MKYLRKYESDVFSSGIKHQLQDFCEGNLAYLLDENFEVRVEKYTEYYQIEIQKLRSLEAEEYEILFKWNDVKDYIIPFIQRLSNSYELLTNEWWSYSWSPCQLTSGILIHYLRPKYAHDNTWYKYLGSREDSTFQPSLEQVINDEIDDNTITKYNWNCMDFIHEINIIVEKKKL